VSDPRRNPSRDAEAFAAGQLPDGLRVYAIGDIHGRFDLLQTLYGEIRRDLERSRPQRSTEVFLGDYIDRGPHSREVIEWLVRSQPACDERICLMGNHEDLLLGALDREEEVAVWFHNGGVATLLSYYEGPRAQLTFNQARHAFLGVFPSHHRAFVENLPPIVMLGGYIFVHAGLNPARALDDQQIHDLVWIREPFLSSNIDFGRVVVHGHTPATEPEIRANRINIDTGAFFTGRLTCLVLERDRRRFLHTSLETAGPLR
jgi:serine/threonine protein phosphatase 1